MTLVPERQDILVLAIDPGVTVGWTMGRGPNLETKGETEWQEFLMLMHGIHEEHGLQRVVIERFDIRQFSNDAAITIEIIGAIKYICRLRRWPWSEVGANDKKKFYDYAHQYTTGHAADAEAIRLYDLEYGKW